MHTNPVQSYKFFCPRSSKSHVRSSPVNTSKNNFQSFLCCEKPASSELSLLAFLFTISSRARNSFPPLK